MSKKQRNHDQKAEADAPAPAADVFPAAPQADGVDDVPVPAAESRVPSAAVEAPPADDDRYLRLAAEYDNFRKRTAKERMEMSPRAQGELLKRLIDPLDDLARVIAQGPGARDAKTVLDAVEVVDKKMMKALADAGLEVLNPVGAVFDPEQHEAVSTAPAASPEEDHLVAMVFQPGYRFHGQLLRPARVVVKQWNG
jgi:molecular chaperone GrpE